MTDSIETVLADGCTCYVNRTSALECWLIMHSMRRVLNGWDDLPKRKGRMVHIASDPLLEKEIAFINEMHATGACPPLKTFQAQLGTTVGMTDYEIRDSTTLPGWDGWGRPLILSNPKWYEDGAYVPVPPDFLMSEYGSSISPNRGFLDEGEEDVADDGSLGFSVDDLVRPAESETTDFTWVKDRVQRDAALAEWHRLSVVLHDFVRRRLRPAVTAARWSAAARRLGVPDDLVGFDDGSSLDAAVTDFAAMLDDSSGSPAFAEVLAHADAFTPVEQRAAEFFRAYRYTWLKVEAVNTGVGLKCLDLMTGKGLFLIEPDESRRPDVKGSTLCAGIAPAGRYSVALGAYHRANFDDPAVILRIVLTHLGLPTETPVSLSAADSARLAAETIGRVYRLGHI